MAAEGLNIDTPNKNPINSIPIKTIDVIKPLTSLKQISYYYFGLIKRTSN